MLKKICKMVTVTAASHDEVEKAIARDDFSDFEDCLQDRCAVGVSADYIITRNVNDYNQAEVQAITPNDFVDMLMKYKERQG